jgi:hypothetical protein
MRLEPAVPARAGRNPGSALLISTDRGSPFLLVSRVSTGMFTGWHRAVAGGVPWCAAHCDPLTLASCHIPAGVRPAQPANMCQPGTWPPGRSPAVGTSSRWRRPCPASPSGWRDSPKTASRGPVRYVKAAERSAACTTPPACWRSYSSSGLGNMLHIAACPWKALIACSRACSWDMPWFSNAVSIPPA